MVLPTSVAGVGVAGVDRKGLSGKMAPTGHGKAFTGGLGGEEVAESSAPMVAGVAVGGGEVAGGVEGVRLILLARRKGCPRESSVQQVRSCCSFVLPCSGRDL